MRQFLDLKSFIGTPKVKKGEHEEAHKALSWGEEERGGLSSMDNKHGWNVAEIKSLVIFWSFDWYITYIIGFNF